MLVFCEECGSRNLFEGDKRPERFRCRQCGYENVAAPPPPVAAGRQAAAGDQDYRELPAGDGCQKCIDGDR